MTVLAALRFLQENEGFHFQPCKHTFVKVLDCVDDGAEMDCAMMVRKQYTYRNFLSINVFVQKQMTKQMPLLPKCTTSSRKVQLPKNCASCSRNFPLIVARRDDISFHAAMDDAVRSRFDAGTLLH